MDPRTYWNAALSGADAVFSRTGADRASVRAIGLSSQGQTFIPIDREGNPLHSAICWMDQRARQIATDWESNWLSREHFRRVTGYPWLPAELTVFKVAWLAEHAPEAHRAWKFLCLPDYLIFRMTGETVTDRVMAQYTGFFDVQKAQWVPEMLAAAGISDRQLPTVIGSGQVAGRPRADAAELLRVPSGTPVCTGANDQLVGAVGSGGIRPGIVSETTGSVMALVATTAAMSNDPNMIAGRHAVPDTYYAMALTMSSGPGSQVVPRSVLRG